MLLKATLQRDEERGGSGCRPLRSASGVMNVHFYSFLPIAAHMSVASRNVPRLSTVNDADIRSDRGNGRSEPRTAADIHGLSRISAAILGSVHG